MLSEFQLKQRDCWSFFICLRAHAALFETSQRVEVQGFIRRLRSVCFLGIVKSLAKYELLSPTSSTTTSIYNAAVRCDCTALFSDRFNDLTFIMPQASADYYAVTETVPVSWQVFIRSYEGSNKTLRTTCTSAITSSAFFAFMKKYCFLWIPRFSWSTYQDQF